jgi:hypothetical protein
MDRSEPDAELLRRCLDGIRYRVWWRPASWATEMGSHMRHGVRRQAAEWYARKRFAETGRLPEGKHKVVARVGRRGDPDADVHLDWLSPEWSPVLRVVITFPSADRPCRHQARRATAPG